MAILISHNNFHVCWLKPPVPALWALPHHGSGYNCVGAGSHTRGSAGDCISTSFQSFPSHWPSSWGGVTLVSRVFGLSLFLCGWLSAQSSCTEKTDPDSKLNIHKNRNRGNFDLLPTCLRPFSLSLSLSEKGSLELDASYPVGAMKGGLFANDRISGPLPRPTPAMWPFLPLAPYGANRRGGYKFSGCTFWNRAHNLSGQCFLCGSISCELMLKSSVSDHFAELLCLRDATPWNRFPATSPKLSSAVKLGPLKSECGPRWPRLPTGF